ncbi:P-loop containing nucleoside triphosphate hydrolase [Sesbania bispinosa]|nr:P-loop containing nucleoside triphosphate hydrolase [Sesbania bispinosa]
MGCCLLVNDMVLVVNARIKGLAFFEKWGAIAGEELIKWEKMEGVSGREEKILVSVRLRPLNEKEIAVNEVADWECINDTTILYRNTLREGSTFPSVYTFDRVFRGDCSTKHVYEKGAREIALSAVGGINSSIFAYGQTSSGKTYTMVGITEDLLSTENTPLRLRDDPEKGPIVEKLTEVTLRDWVHLKRALIILQLKVSAKEFLGKSNSTTLAASVNFVDLAGSERASQALSAGSRLKEGCHINRSLLTLGTVIRKLSKGRQGHINYRDSKLTRILQPSLGGNARTAIICTLSPARSHVEQTRNTLLFACCAKEVTTKAQVNVVMSDKVLVKQLQKEVARLESELRTPGPPATNCDCAAMLRKKKPPDRKGHNLLFEPITYTLISSYILISKKVIVIYSIRFHIITKVVFVMEKEIRELIKQRDLAQSRVEDLLSMVGDNQKTRKERVDTWEDDDSVSESSSIYRPAPHIKEFNNPHYNNEDSGSNPDEYPDEYCKEVQCVELEESSRDDPEYPDPSASDNGVFASPLREEENVINQEMSTLVNEDREERQNLDNSTYGVLDQRHHDEQLSIDSLVCSYPDEQSPQAMLATMSNFRNLQLTRSWSCREHYMSGSPEKSGEIERTPSNGFEKCFPGRPDGLRRKFLPLTYSASSSTKLSTNGSPSSIGSPSMDELRTNSTRTTANEDITSIQTFVAGMKEMVKLEYEKQLVDDQDQLREVKPYKFEKNMRDVGIDSMGDPTDSIYMEVELRRLSFLEETFRNGNQTVKDGHTVTLTSRLIHVMFDSCEGNSVKALRRERGMVAKLMKKRLSEKERENLFNKWGIALDSKRRRMQLANRLWSNTDMNHIVESAAIVAKLVRFTEQGNALKEMFGLSFTPNRTLSYFWKNSRASLF